MVRSGAVGPVCRALLLLGCAFVAACGDNHTPDSWPFFTWHHETEVGSYDLDHLDATTMQPILDRLQLAAADDSVVLLYGHIPGEMTSFATIDTVLARARELGLETFTFADLAAGGPPRAGICLSFDDTEVDAWYAMRDLLARYDAHVSFFVTLYATWNDAEKAELHQLYADGDSIEAHSVNHLNGPAYVASHGMAAYLADEVEPSITILRDDGFTPVAFSFPYGAHTPAMEHALVPVIPIARGITERPRD